MRGPLRPSRQWRSLVDSILHMYIASEGISPRSSPLSHVVYFAFLVWWHISHRRGHSLRSLHSLHSISPSLSNYGKCDVDDSAGFTDPSLRLRLKRRWGIDNNIRNFSERSIHTTATMQLPPPSVMATWPKPNYEDPVTRGHGAIIVNVVCLSVALIVTLLRLYTRLRITCSPGLDDIFIVAALV